MRTVHLPSFSFKQARRPRIFSLPLAFALAASLAACGSSGNNGSSSAANPFSGKTINLISSGAAGSAHDLLARAVAPYIAKYLHTTVDVKDMPGGGQLLAWNYVSAAPPDGLTIGTIDVEGILANLWEKVPGQKANPGQLTMLGGGAGGITGDSEIMYAATSANPIYSNIYNLAADRSTKVKELGSVGDVPGPLFFQLYHVPYVDLSSYSDSSAELQGMLRGDGDIDVKTWSGSWESYATSGKGKVLLAFSMRPTWQQNPSVPTVAQLLKKDPIAAAGRSAMVADSTALDAGTGMFGPPGIPAAQAAALRNAIAYAYTQAGFKKDAVNGGIATAYESWQAQNAAIQAGLVTSTIANIRKFVPLSTGVAS